MDRVVKDCLDGWKGETDRGCIWSAHTLQFVSAPATSVREELSTLHCTARGTESLSVESEKENPVSRNTEILLQQATRKARPEINSASEDDCDERGQRRDHARPPGADDRATHRRCPVRGETTCCCAADAADLFAHPLTPAFATCSDALASRVASQTDGSHRPHENICAVLL